MSDSGAVALQEPPNQTLDAVSDDLDAIAAHVAAAVDAAWASGDALTTIRAVADHAYELGLRRGLKAEPRPSDDTVDRDQLRIELERLNAAFVTAETLAHEVELLNRAATEASDAVKIARDAAYILAAWRLGIPGPDPRNWGMYRVEKDVNAATGATFTEYHDLYAADAEKSSAGA